MNGFVKKIGFWCVFALVAGSPARAQDEVRYRDRATKKETRFPGKIQEETPDHITIKPTVGPARKIPATDIIDVDYELPGAPRVYYKNALFSEKAAAASTKAAERRKALTEALMHYRQILPRVSGNPKRHIEFKIARVLAWQAEEDPAQTAAAIKRLTQFKKDYPDSWQITACCNLLANLQARQHKYEAAQKTYEDLAAIPNLSPQTRQTCNVKIADMMIKAQKYVEAKKQIQDLAKGLPPDDPQRMRLNISLAECQAAAGEFPQAVKLLEDIVSKPMSNDLMALAYNTLGDCYRTHNKPAEARWDYLYVDVIYHQNREEHARAVYWLAKVFQQLGDVKKAQQYRDRLLKDKEFAGSEYQRALLAEK